MSSNPRAERRVLLRMEEGADRRLLGEWLADEPGYFPVVADSTDAFNAEFDCVVLDTETLSEAGTDLSARRRMEPVFLPVLLVLPERNEGAAFEALDRLPSHVRESIDDTIEAPIQRRVLRNRLDTLLCVREYAEQLNRSRDRYHRLLELLPEAVLLLRDGAVEYVNEASIHLLAREEPDLVGTHPVQFVDPADRQALARFLWNLESGHRQDGVRVTLTTDAGPVPVEFRGVRLYEEDAETPLLQLLVRDLRNIEEPAELR